MARYAVEHIWEGKQEYFLIRDHQSWQMVLFPSKYLTHLIRANRSPNTVGRRAKSIRFYLEYLDEKKMELSQVAELEFQEQYEHYVGFLHWLKAGNHLHEKKEKLPSNKTCNAYLKDVFRFFCFLELESDMERLKVLYYDSFTTHDSIGHRCKTEAAVPVIQWLSERGRTKRPSGRASGDFGTFEAVYQLQGPASDHAAGRDRIPDRRDFRCKLYQRY